jgi:hypothetical protein
MAAPLHESLPQPAFKFNQSFKVNIFTSLLFVPIAFVLIMAFAISNLQSESATYDGLIVRESQNTSSFSFVLPIPRSHFLSYLVILKIESAFPDSFYSINAEMFCQWFDVPSRKIHRKLLNVARGEYPLFVTSVDSYRSLLLVIQIMDLSGRHFESVQIVTVQNKVEFQRRAKGLRMICFFVSLVLGIFYAVALRYLAEPPLRSQQILTLASLGLSALVNLPMAGLVKTTTIVALDRGLCGAFSAFNLVCLFCFLQTPSTVRFVLPICVLFIMAAAMLWITGDTTLLSCHFNDNSAVWVFFLSVSGTATAGYSALLLWRLLSAFCRARTTQKHLLLAYALATFIALACTGVEALMFAIRGFCPVSISFSAHYLAQSLLSALFADIHWPLLTEEGFSEDWEEPLMIHETDTVCV